MSPAEREGLKARNGGARATALSALTGEGIDDLLRRLDRMLESASLMFELHLGPEDGAGLAWAYAHGRVLARRDRTKAVSLTISIDPEEKTRFEKRYGEKIAFNTITKPAS